MKAVAILLTVLCLSDAVAFAQPQGKKSGSHPLGSNSEGTHFIVGFMQNEDRDCAGSYGQQKIMIASRFTTSVVIRMPDGQVIRDQFVPGQLRSYNVDMLFECVGEGVFANSVDIRATNPICVYCYSSKRQTSDGYMAIPVDVWGTEYVTANYALDQYDIPNRGGYLDTLCSIIPRGGEFAIIASEDNTNVAVFPTTRTMTSMGAPRIAKVLMKGEMWQVQDGGTVRGATDITGSAISADKPVGLLSGHMRTAVPFRFNTKDHIIEMIPPRNALGRNFVAVPFGGRLSGDLIRIISCDASPTSVTLKSSDGQHNWTINKLGGFVEYDMHDVSVITTDHPVLVTQYAKSENADPRNNGPAVVVAFDPDMVVVTPTEQYAQSALFETMPDTLREEGRVQYDEHYVTLIAERDKFSTLRLNGQPLADQPGIVGADVPNTNYHWATVKIGDGRVHSLTGDALFGGYVYGLGPEDSYAWPIGCGVRKFDVTDSTAPVVHDSIECSGVFVTVYESGPFQSGLRRIWIDSAGSSNVQLQLTQLMIGDEYGEGHVLLQDPRKPGHARIIAEDQAGNRDTVDFDVVASIQLTFSADAVAFADVLPSVSYSQLFVISNPNPVPVTIDHLLLRRGREFIFDKDYTGVVIPPKGSVTVKIFFQSPAKQDQFDTLDLTAACQTYSIPFSAHISSPKIATEDLDFKTLRSGTVRSLPLRVWNSGTIPLRIDSAVIAGTSFSMQTPLQHVVLLDPGKDTSLIILFSPQSVGGYTGTVSFYSTADSVAVAHLRGVAVYPEIRIGGYDYGTIQVGDTLCTTVPVTNIGGDTAHLTGLQLSQPRAFLPDPSVFPHDLASGDTLWVKICFVPDSERVYTSDILPLNSDGLEDKNQIVGGGYQLRAAIGGYDWHARWVGTTNDSIVYVHNRSSQALTVSTVWIDGPQSNEFAVEPLKNSVVLNGNDSLPVKVSFIPAGPGYRSCMIHAGTSSRLQATVDSVLQGIGLKAGASDSLAFDNTLSYSCDGRPGSLTLRNDGNTPLTVADFQLTSVPPLATLVDPSPVGTVIPVGGSLAMNFKVDFAGYVGTVTGSFAWSFTEIPRAVKRGSTPASSGFQRSFSIRSEAQQFTIAAVTPQSVAIGGKFDLVVNVAAVHWPGIGVSGVKVKIQNNPTVARFDVPAWNTRAAGAVNGWIPDGAPVVEKSGVVTISFRPASGGVLPLDNVSFIPFPYDGFLGNNSRDSFSVTLIPANPPCSPQAATLAPYQVDSICGLSSRLIQVTGGAYQLKQSAPNPSGTTATIEFTLGMEAQTTLELVDVNGASVGRLVDGVLPAGRHTVDVDVRKLPSGLYYYRLNSGPYNAVRTMTIAK